MGFQKLSLMKLATLSILFFIVMTTSVFGQTNSISAIQVGDTVENFTAADSQGKLWILREALDSGPVVLIFYRGQWCPYCNRHLSEFQDSLATFSRLGVQIVAVSPERPEKLVRTIEKTDAEYTLLWDENYKLSDYFNLTFLPSSTTRAMYNSFLGADLYNSHSDTTGRLPIPATFIIGSDGIVKWLFVDENYKNRSSVTEIIQQLRILENGK